MILSHRFWNSLNQKNSWFDNLKFDYVVPNVGCIMDSHHNPRLFEKWYKFPNKAHRLFRRLHANDKSIYNKRTHA